MKVRLTLELDLPDDTPLVPGYEQASLGELLSDTVTNYLAVAHSRDALKWCARAKVGMPDEDAGGRQIFEHHRQWADICKAAPWSFEQVGPK